MRQLKRVFLILAMSLVAVQASGQEGCGKMLLLPLHYGEMQIEEDDRAFLNTYYYCLQRPQSEEAALEEGIDLTWVYPKALPSEADVLSSLKFDKLKAWADQNCETYLAQGSTTQLTRAIDNALVRTEPKIGEAYERCVKSTGVSCYAVPAGRDVVGLFVKWAPDGPGAAEPEILSASATGAMQPLDMLDKGTSDGTKAPVKSLEHLKVPRTGLLRSFLRTDKAGDVLFEVKTSADPNGCSETVGPVVPRSRVKVVRDGDNKPNIKLGRHVWIDVENLQAWIEGLRDQNKLPKPDAKVGDLVPFIDGVPLVGIHPINHGDKPEIEEESGAQVHRLHFDIERDDENKEEWAHLLYLGKKLSFSRPVKVTVGFENDETLDTLITGEEPYAAHLKVVPGDLTLIGLLLIGGGLFLFLYLAWKTDVIRDTTVPLRPDNRSPFSLGRTQMAFWFFLVVAVYFGLWMVTGDKDTITDSTVGLIGISAATALGAAFVDANKTSKNEKTQRVAQVDLSKRRKEIVEFLDQKRKEAVESCEKFKKTLNELTKGGKDTLAAKEDEIKRAEDLAQGLRQERDQIAQDDKAALAAKDEEIKKAEDLAQKLEQERDKIVQGNLSALEAKKQEIERVNENLALLRRQIDFFCIPAWRRFLDDLLTENEGISFHKFQIFVWTLILGAIFVFEVLNKLAIPEFNATLLAIMGISGGTYVGFKLPSGTKQSNSTDQESTR